MVMGCHAPAWRGHGDSKQGGNSNRAPCRRADAHRPRRRWAAPMQPGPGRYILAKCIARLIWRHGTCSCSSAPMSVISCQCLAPARTEPYHGSVRSEPGHTPSTAEHCLVPSYNSIGLRVEWCGLGRPPSSSCSPRYSQEPSSASPLLAGQLHQPLLLQDPRLHRRVQPLPLRPSHHPTPSHLVVASAAGHIWPVCAVVAIYRYAQTEAMHDFKT